MVVEVDDRVLVEAAQAGDLDAFETLVRRYQAPVYRIALRLMQSSADADDVTQDTFIRAWRSLARFRGDSALSTLSGLRGAWDDVQALARVPVPIPPGLTARIMHRVRDLARRAAENLLLAGARGHTQISHTVIAQVARRAALAVPGVLFASARPTSGRSDDPARLDLAVRLVTIYGPALHAIAAAVRTTLRRRLTTLTGADVDRIDVTFIDIDIDSRAPKP